MVLVVVGVFVVDDEPLLLDVTAAPTATAAAPAAKAPTVRPVVAAVAAAALTEPTAPAPTEPAAAPAPAPTEPVAPAAAPVVPPAVVLVTVAGVDCANAAGDKTKARESVSPEILVIVVIKSFKVGAEGIARCHDLLV